MTNTSTEHVELRGELTRLREFREDDADQVLDLIGDDRVTRWLSFDSRSRAQAAAMLAGVAERARSVPRTEYYLAVCARDQDQTIGFARLALSGVQAGKLGYAVHADHWGHGYATDAVKTMIRFGFNDLGLHRISAAIGPDNGASITIATKLGFNYEGRLRDHVYTNGAWRDSLLYSLLEDEWNPLDVSEHQ